MKKNLLFAVLLLLTVFTTRSQGITSSHKRGEIAQNLPGFARLSGKDSTAREPERELPAPSNPKQEATPREPESQLPAHGNPKQEATTREPGWLPTADSNSAKQASTSTRPVCFPFWMVKEIALDLEEKSRLEKEVQLLSSEKEFLKQLTTGLEQKDHDRQLQLALLEKNRKLLAVQLNTAKALPKGESRMTWTLRLLAALGTGFLLGRI